MSRYLVDHDGTWWAVLPGENHPDEALRAAAAEVGEPSPSLVSKVEHLAYQPRVKWCSNHGWPCDFEGEWHSHWNGVKPGDETAHTLVRFAPAACRSERIAVRDEEES